MSINAKVLAKNGSRKAPFEGYLQMRANPPNSCKSGFGS